jgi:Carboxypeptidase regulatory-like domain
MRLEISRRFSRIFVLLTTSLLASVALGQNASTGEIKGTVSDSSGALVEGVKITITNLDTGVSIYSATNSAGIYDAPSVPIGPYTITFSKTGFKEFVRKGIALQLQTIAIDATLQPGSTTEEVTVIGDVPLLQTETSDQQLNLNTKAVQDSPIVGTTWFSELTKVLPGASGGGTGNRAGSGGDGIAANGTQAFTANYQIEGTAVTDVRDGNVSNNYPPVDAIAEVSISTANAGAQSANAVSLNVNLKSGANRWHGSLFEFDQNDLFNSRNYFQTTGKKAVERWNEFGGSVGGPIVKDKVFFFFTYQRNPVQSSGFFTTTVPTAAMRQGNFSDPSFHATIYDKSSCSPAPCARSPLNGGSNMLLSTQIDPVAANILSYFPQPTDPNASTNNYSAVVGTPSKSTWYSGKIDYQISPNNRLAGAVVEYPNVLTFNPDALCGLGFDCTRSTPNNRNQSARVTETWTINPTMVNEFRMGAYREHDQYANPTFGKGFLTKLGIEPTYGPQAPADVFPNITVSSSSLAIAAQTFIGGGVHANLVEDGYYSSDVLTLIRGRHTVKLGGELDRWFQHDTTWGDASSGDFTFTGVGTNSGTSPDPRNGGATSTGVPFADFLLGDVGTWNIFNGEPTNIASWITDAFVNDDFKVTQRLTLNLGLRFQHQTGWAVADGRFGNFNPTLPNPGAFLPPGALGAMQYGKINGHNTIEPSVNEWAPRIGFAWSPWNKWSFRGSYGVFQVPRGTELYAHDNFPATLGFGFNPQGFIGDGTNVAFQLQSGPPPGSLKFPTASTLTPDEFNFQRVAYYPPKLPLQYFQEFLLSVQRELPANHLLDVSYVHTKGTHLNFEYDMNQVPASDLANPSNTGDFSPLRPVPWFRSILFHDFSGWSNYDALQLRIAKRLSHGVYYQFNYAWSKMLDTGTGDGHDQNIDIWQIAGNHQANYGLSAIDATHNFSGSIGYDLPFGEARQFPVHGVLNQIVGGWRISSVIQARSGIPFTPTVSGNANGGDLAKSGSPNCFCGYSLLPNRIGSGKLSNPTLSEWFDVSAFTDPTNNGTTPAFGDSGRDILRGPRFVEVDMSLGKAFRIREGMGLEIRADATNAFNHPLFSLPDANILSSTAGQITSAQGANNFGPGRIIQMGGRFTF